MMENKKQWVLMISSNTSEQKQCFLRCLEDSELHPTKDNLQIPVLPCSEPVWNPEGVYLAFELKLPISCYDFFAPRQKYAFCRLFELLKGGEEDAVIVKYKNFATDLNREFANALGSAYSEHALGVFLNCDFGYDVDFWVLLSPNCSVTQAQLTDLLTDFCKQYTTTPLPAGADNYFDEIYQEKARLASIQRNIFDAKYTKVMQALDKQYASLSSAEDQRRRQCAYLASLLLYTEVTESVKRWIYDAGNLIEENVETSSLYDKMTYRLFDRMWAFIEQSSSKSSLSERIWCHLYLLSSLEHLFCRELEPKLAENCGGLYPVIQDVSAVNSEYPVHYSKELTFGFIYLPLEKHSFWSYFPAMIHELHHYIPTYNRIERNKAILALIVNAVIKQNLKQEYLEDAEIASKYQALLTKVSAVLYNNFKKYFEEGLTPSEIVDLDMSSDSMTYAENLREYLYMVDFLEILQKEAELLAISPFLSMDSCLQTWNEHRIDYMYTFISFMREVHSDYCMVELLNINLEKYVELMASEPTFAQLSEEYIAPSSVIRFCFMTRYLHAKQCNRSMKEVDIFSWKKACLEACQKVLSDPLRHNTARNLIQYLNKYHDAKDNLLEHCTLPHLREDLEGYVLCLLKGGEFGICVCETEKSWQFLLDKYQSLSDWKAIQHMYDSYVNASPVERSKIDLRTKVVFRDLLNWLDLK